MNAPRPPLRLAPASTLCLGMLLGSLSLPAGTPGSGSATESVSAAQAATLTFSFGQEAGTGLAVYPDSTYNTARGWGFDLGTKPVQLQHEVQGKPALLGLGLQGPVYFSARLPGGNYRVKLRFSAPLQPGELWIKAESRRLLIERAQAKVGESQELEFTVNIRDARLRPPPANAPGGDHVVLNDREQGVLHWDDKLTLEFNGHDVCLQSLSISPALATTTVFLVGDSTVTDQPGEPAAGWGQMLPRWFGPQVAVANHAESGETLKSFLTAHRLDKVLEDIHSGDYLFIQFGHNDSKAQWPQTYVAPDSTYPAYLNVFIAEARRRGAIPVLVTSMHRRRFDAQGHIIDTHGGYPDAVRAVAAELKVPLIDLHHLSQTLWETLGAEGSAAAFIDATHQNNYGGYELARCVVSEIRRQLPELARKLRPEASDFDPARPDPLSSFAIPASLARLRESPRGN